MSFYLNPGAGSNVIAQRLKHRLGKDKAVKECNRHIKSAKSDFDRERWQIIKDKLLKSKALQGA